MKFYDYYESPVGTLLIMEEQGSLIRADLVSQKKSVDTDACQKNTELIQRAKTQLEEYFAGIRKNFDLPLAPAGTPFQKKIWGLLCTIPYGETRSYQDIAIQAENPKGCRAVGMANNRNPIIIIIPCHRVIGKNGSMVGYGGGLPVKEWLLEHEKYK